MNVGGIHHAPGRDKVLPYVFLGARERDEIRALVSDGARVVARDLPAARGVGADELLGAG